MPNQDELLPRKRRYEPRIDDEGIGAEKHFVKTPCLAEAWDKLQAVEAIDKKTEREYAGWLKNSTLPCPAFLSRRCQLVLGHETILSRTVALQGRVQDVRMTTVEFSGSQAISYGTVRPPQHFAKIKRMGEWRGRHARRHAACV